MEILILNDCNENHKEAMSNAAKGCNFTYKDDVSVTNEDIEKANIIIGKPKVELMRYAKNLKWLQLCSAGADEYLVPGVLSEDCVITNATGAYGLAVSEHMLSLVFMLMKKLNLYFENQQNHEWKREGKIKSIYNSTFVILGMGDIGSEFAKKVKALGGHTIGVKRSAIDKPDYLDEVYTLEKLDEVIPRADVFVMCIPGNEKTYHLMNRDRIKLMKKDSILINGGRGTTIDLDALCDAIESNEIYGAGIDVTDPEPLNKDNRAWDVKNLVITPHIAGGFHLQETFERFMNIATFNLDAYLNDKPMKNRLR